MSQKKSTDTPIKPLHRLLHRRPLPSERPELFDLARNQAETAKVDKSFWRDRTGWWPRTLSPGSEFSVMTTTSSGGLVKPL